MFKATYQSGLLSIFSSCGSNPLQLWQVEVKNGHIKRITDKDISSFVLEIVGCNVSTTYIITPKGNKTLGITLPYMVMLVKNMKKPFTFEVTVMDSEGVRRRIRVSTFLTKTVIHPMSASMPIALHAGWNKIQVNLAEYTSRSFHTQFLEVANVKINANIRLRRIYFTNSLLSEDELPHDYRLYKPIASVMKKGESKYKENIQQQTIKTGNEIKGSKVNVKLEPKIEKVEATQGDIAIDTAPLESKPSVTEGETVAVEATQGDIAIDTAPLESKPSVTEGETVAVEGTQGKTAIDTAPLESKPSVTEGETDTVVTLLKSEHTEPATNEPSETGEPKAVDEATPTD